jgi:hypothetical protein
MRFPATSTFPTSTTPTTSPATAKKYLSESEFSLKGLRVRGVQTVLEKFTSPDRQICTLAICSSPSDICSVCAGLGDKLPMSSVASLVATETAWDQLESLVHQQFIFSGRSSTAAYQYCHWGGENHDRKTLVSLSTS